MTKVAKFVGLDVHKDSVAIAYAEGGPIAEAHSLCTLAHDVPRIIKKLLALAPAEDLHVVYEAGPTGYGLCRALLEKGIDCIVVAPNKVPRAPGRRVKTDKRDAKDLAHQLRMGSLRGITLPDRASEALRDLVRCREDCVRALRRARQQLKGFLLRHGIVWKKKSSWTVEHRKWLSSLQFPAEPHRVLMVQSLNEIDRLARTRDFLQEKIEQLAPSLPNFDLYRALQALRGVSTLVAVTLACELGDLTRFPSAGRLMSFVGLTPSEHSSGSKTKRGPITKAGNAHVRRVLVEAAWSGRLDPRKPVRLLRRQKGLDPKILDIAWQAQNRLHHRYVHLRKAGHEQNVAIVALARELAGFVWAIGREVATLRSA